MKITAKRPEELFEWGDSDHIKAQYRKLAKQYHPDAGGTDEDFQRLGQLYAEALKLIEHANVWDTGKMLTWVVPGSVLHFRYAYKYETETCTVYVGRVKVLIVFKPSYEDLAKTAQQQMKCSIGPPRMADKNAALLPRLVPDVCGGQFVMIHKEVDELPLRYVLDHHGPFAPQHAAWAIGRMMHLLCYLNWAKIVHADFSVDALFVNLRRHTLHLYCGWEFTTPIASKLVALPARTARIAPREVLASKMPTHKLDMECARHLAITLLGAKTPTELRMQRDLPKPLVEWLTQPVNASTAFDMYTEWEAVRDASFGARKFIEFPFDSNQLYMET